MDDYNALRSQDIMTASIFTFLENLLAAVRTSETLASEAQDRDQINVSSDIKPGGYSEDIFIFLSEREKEEYICCVCYLVIKDVHQCSNGHKFCYSCIYVWSTCNRTGADCCPACRCEGVYARNEQLNEKICCKRVKCQDEGCNWRGFLRDYIEHEHRHYEFKELSRSIDLPNINVSDIPKVISPPPLLSIGSVDLDKTVPDIIPNHSQPEPNSNSLAANNVQNQENRVTVSRTNLGPRRLSRLSDNAPNVLRTVGPRSIVNTYPRNVNVTSSRCPNNNHSSNHQPRPPRIPRINRPNDMSTQSNNPRTTENSLGRINQNESTQTYSDETREESIHTPILSSLLDSSREHETRLPRLVSSNNRESHSPLFPPINTSGRNSLSTDRPVMEYRRLAPTYASRRQNMGYMTDGQENFTRMLILLTSDLDDRHPTNRNQSRNHNPFLSMAPSSESNQTNSDNFQSRSMANNRSSSRLQEFRNLNRRLSEVANSLDMLIESTSRQGAVINSNDSSTSDNISDTEG